MFKVECESCHAPYELDEKRLPPGGLKMRCPKCGTSFVVRPPGAAGAAPAASADVTATAPGRQHKPTVMGVGSGMPAGMGKAAAMKGTIVGQPMPPAVAAIAAELQQRGQQQQSEPPLELDLPDLPAPKPKPSAPAGAFGGGTPAGAFGSGPPKVQVPRPIAIAPTAPAPPPDVEDLPAPKPAQGNRSFGRPAAVTEKLPTPAASAAPSFSDLELDLPMKKATSPGAQRPGPKLDVDLPAPKPRVAPAAPAKPPAPAPAPVAKPAPAPASDAFEVELDLPAPVARRPAPAPAAPAAPAPRSPSLDSDFELDLPAPVAARRPGGALDELDLPVAKAKAPTPAPVHAPAAPRPTAARKADSPGGRRPTPIGGHFDDLDLPMPKGSTDLPTPKKQTPAIAIAAPAAAGFDDLDLPMPKGSADLPAPRAAGRGGADPGGVDLPARKGFGDLDLPMPKAGGGLTDLPTPKGGFADLPQAKGFDDLDLPLPKGAADLPAPKMDLDLPIARGAADLPAPRGAADLPAPRGASDLPVARGGIPGAPAYGDIDTGDRTRDGRGGAGGMGFGELDLDGGGAVPTTSDLPPRPAAAEAGMEFDDIPQEAVGQPSAAATRTSKPNVAQVERSAQTRSRVAVAEPTDRPRRGKALPAVMVLLLLVVGAGVASGFLTPYGFFGMYYFEQFLPAAGSPGAARSTIERAETKAKTDTYADVRESLKILARARRETGLNRELLSRSLLHEALYQIRFGEDAASASRAAAIQSRLEERGSEAPGIDLGGAAYSLRAGETAAVKGALTRARRRGPNDPYLYLVEGELALRQDRLEDALAAFETAATKGGAARALWGAARARLRGTDAAASVAAIERTLAESPRHVEARLARARIALGAGDHETALRMVAEAAGVEQVEGQALRGSREQRAEAFALLGSIHERLGHRREAREAYEQSLESSPYGVQALVGLGRVLLEEQRYRDALARFEAAVSTQGSDQALEPGGRTAAAEARLGAARAMLALDRPQDAKAALSQLVEQTPEDPDVLLWLGRAEEKLDDNAGAESHYREAIRVAPERFAPYLALAQLFFTAGRPTEANALMAEAESRVPDSAAVRVQRGDAELARNELPRAIAEYRRAIELEANHVPALFGLGAASRRSGQLDEADRAFAAVAERDALYPGLALERGLVFEAKGESDRAARSYEIALREHPDDPDLLLRLGAAQVAAGQLDAAERTLGRVMEQRPNAAEAEHFMGRVAFARGELPEALQHFQAALDRDATRAEFHLHTAWAHLELGDLGRALERVEQAISRDPSQGDAYWIRGRIRVRTGAVRDALTDLGRALELKPSRFEAYAAMGDAYDQLRRVGDAIRSYEQAVQRDPQRGEWFYRLGRLNMDAGRERSAETALARATTLGEAESPRPGWLADAHRIQGDALRLTGQRPAAVEHYRRYLELAPPGALDREEVEGNIEDLTRR